MVLGETKIKRELQAVSVASVHGYSEGVAAQIHVIGLSRLPGVWPTGIAIGGVFQVNSGSLTIRQ